MGVITNKIVDKLDGYQTVTLKPAEFVEIMGLTLLSSVQRPDEYNIIRETLIPKTVFGEKRKLEYNTVDGQFMLRTFKQLRRTLPLIRYHFYLFDNVNKKRFTYETAFVNEFKNLAYAEILAYQNGTKVIRN
ncbi:MAG: hypothetical protein IKS48_13705 [Eubacterium sp.]|nr:hypothetical protein [Eubacterium sp.]